MCSNKPLVSIIVPIYNAEAFLKPCISSILDQSYHNIEVILVDDGSTDSSLKICAEYKEKDSRIVVLTGDNEGVSYARNKGLDIAKGDWITFVDADDRISKVFIESLLNATGNKTDVIAASELIRFQTDTELSRIENENVEKVKLFEIQRLMLKEAVFVAPKKDGFLPNHCNKLYHVSVLKNAEQDPLRFDKHIYYGEDQLFFYNALVNSNGLTYIHRPLYYYRMNGSSAMNQEWNLKWDTVLDAFEQIMEIVKQYDGGKAFPPYIAYQNTCVSLFLRKIKVKTIDKKLQRHMRKIVYKRFGYYLTDKDISFERKLYAIGFLAAPELTAKFNLLYGKIKTESLQHLKAGNKI